MFSGTLLILLLYAGQAQGADHQTTIQLEAPASPNAISGCPTGMDLPWFAIDRGDHLSLSLRQQIDPNKPGFAGVLYTPDKKPLGQIEVTLRRFYGPTCPVLVGKSLTQLQAEDTLWSHKQTETTLSRGNFFFGALEVDGCYSLQLNWREIATQYPFVCLRITVPELPSPEAADEN